MSKKTIEKRLVKAFFDSRMSWQELSRQVGLSERYCRQQINGWKYPHAKMLEVLEKLAVMVSNGYRVEPSPNGTPTQPTPAHCQPKSYADADLVPPPQPRQICTAHPGTLEKIEILRQRAARKEHLWHPGDHGYGGDPLGNA